MNDGYRNLWCDGPDGAKVRCIGNFTTLQVSWDHVKEMKPMLGGRANLIQKCQNDGIIDLICDGPEGTKIKFYIKSREINDLIKYIKKLKHKE